MTKPPLSAAKRANERIRGDSESAIAHKRSHSANGSGNLSAGRDNAAVRLELFDFLRFLFSFPAMLGTMLVGGVYLTSRQFIVDPDCWWHIKTGEIILATHHWPHFDPYSYTVAGHPWLSYEWGGDVILALAARWGGLRGLDAFLIVVSGAILIALYYLATLCSKNSKAGFVAAVALFVLAVPSFSLRPQMLGYLFLILTLIILERFRQGHRNSVWFLPLLFLVWVNSHGSWIIGLGAVVAYWLSGLFEFQLGRPRNPPLEPARSRPPLARISAEPLRAADHALRHRTLHLSVPGRVLPAHQRRQYSRMAADALQHARRKIIPRHGSWLYRRAGHFQIHMAPRNARPVSLRHRDGHSPRALPAALRAVLRAAARRDRRALGAPYNRAKDQFALNAVLMIGAIAAMIYYFPTRAELEDKVAENFPVGAVAYLDQHDVPGPMLNSYGFGGYLVYSRGPEHKVFIDGRSELYEAGGLLYDYMQVAGYQARRPARFFASTASSPCFSIAASRSSP